MDDEIKESFIRLLKEIISGDLSNVDSVYGLCGNLSELIGETLEELYFFGYDFVENNCSDWEHYSGHRTLPIAGYSIRTNWQGEKLKLRQSLAQHLLTKLEENTYAL